MYSYFEMVATRLKEHDYSYLLRVIHMHVHKRRKFPPSLTLGRLRTGSAMSSPLSSSTPKAGPRGKGRPARKGRGKGTAALGGKAAGEESAVSFSPTHSPNESGCAVSLAEKAELQHLNEELETYVNSQEGERSEWESSVREEIMNESFKTQAETVQQYCSKEKAMSEELVELRKALDVEKNAGRRKESE